MTYHLWKSPSDCERWAFWQRSWRRCPQTGWCRWSSRTPTRSPNRSSSESGQNSRLAGNICKNILGDHLVLVGRDDPLKGMAHHGEGDRGLGQSGKVWFSWHHHPSLQELVPCLLLIFIKMLSCSSLSCFSNSACIPGFARDTKCWCQVVDPTLNRKTENFPTSRWPVFYLPDLNIFQNFLSYLWLQTSEQAVLLIMKKRILPEVWTPKPGILPPGIFSAHFCHFRFPLLLLPHPHHKVFLSSYHRRWTRNVTKFSEIHMDKKT